MRKDKYFCLIALLISSPLYAQGVIKITLIPKLTPEQAVAILVASKSDTNMTGVYWASKIYGNNWASGSSVIYVQPSSSTDMTPRRLDGTPLSQPVTVYGATYGRVTGAFPNIRGLR